MGGKPIQAMKQFNPIFILVLTMAISHGQKRDPRSVALAGATSTIAEGIYSVGYHLVCTYVCMRVVRVTVYHI